MSDHLPPINYSPEWAARVADHLITLRQRRPLVYAITNFVTMNDVANSLLALGASPVMAQAPEEVVDIVQASQALLLNLGTLTAERLKLIEAALEFAAEYAKPTVLDPVGAGGAQFRTASARRVAQHQAISLVRSNLAEAGALAGLQTAATTRGVDSVGLPGQLTQAVVPLVGQLISQLNQQRTQIGKSLTLVISGVRDWVTDGRQMLALDNGVALLQQISGAGCMLGGICAAFCAITSPYEAAVAGLTVFGIAAELAAQQATGPGSLRMYLLDALYNLTPDQIKNYARIGLI